MRIESRSQAIPLPIYPKIRLNQMNQSLLGSESGKTSSPKNFQQPFKKTENSAAAYAISTLIYYTGSLQPHHRIRMNGPRVSEATEQFQQPLDDRILLRRFVQDANEAAFEAIVRRYQKLVMSVCVRILGPGQDAEDAFQATFICLARRPRSIRHSKALSSWLYTVAYRNSWRLIRHHKKTHTEALETEPMSEPADPLDKISDAQDCVVVDEELNRLPVKFKDVLVMTYFADQTSQQIADTLNISKGTVDGRLRDARNLLRVKLARRGVTIGAIALAASACTQATAATSTTLLNSTLQLGSKVLTNQALAPTNLSHINHLIRPETTMMTTKMITAAILSIVTAGAIGYSGIVFAQQAESTGSDNQTIQPLAGAEDGDSSSSGPFRSGSASPTVSVSPFTAGDDTDPFASNSTNANDGSTNKQSDQAVVQTYSSIPTNASAIEKQIYTALNKPIPPLDFDDGEVSLREILRIILEVINRDGKGHKVNMMLDRMALEAEGITSLDDVLLGDFQLQGIELKKAMNLIFAQTSDPQLDYVIQDDVLLITTQIAAREEDGDGGYFTTRVYPVKQILAMHGTSNTAPTQGGGGSFGGGGDSPSSPSGGDLQPMPEPTPTLMDLIQMMTSPSCSWVAVDGDGGAISLSGNSLIVRQSLRGHEEVVKLLNLLASAKE